MAPFASLASWQVEQAGDNEPVAVARSRYRVASNEEVMCTTLTPGPWRKTGRQGFKEEGEMEVKSKARKSRFSEASRCR